MTVYEQLRAGEYTANPPLDPFEMLVLNALLASEDPSHQVRNSKDVARELGSTRRGVANTRRRIAQKIDIIETQI